MRALALILFALTAQAVEPATPEQLAQVAAQVLDPEAARFRNVEVIGGRYLCGEINGKNVYGGYVGFKRFYFRDGFIIFDDPETPLTMALLCPKGKP